MENCPYCGKKLSNSVFNENQLLTKKEIDLINRFLKLNSSGYCGKCNSENDLLSKAREQFFIFKKDLEKTLDDLEEELTELSKELHKLSRHIPIISLHSPQDWKYKTIEIVSAQVVSGTGMISEIASNWTDFFGLDSGIYNKKIKDAEEKCKSILRVQTINLGGNAILGTDIDYSEAGGGKGMLMVCMAGTAVKISNLNELEYDSSGLEKLRKVFNKINEKIALKEELKSLQQTPLN